MNLKIIFIIANLALWGLVIYVGTTVGLNTWQGVKNAPSSSNSDETKPEIIQSSVADKKPLQAFNRIIREDIFRTENAPPPPKPEPDITNDLKETPLDLQLRGTVVGDNIASYAMIFDGRTRKEEIYRVDEYVQGTRIIEIRKDGVVLQGKNGKEILNLSAPDPVRPSAPIKKPKPPSRKPKRRILKKKQ